MFSEVGKYMAFDTSDTYFSTLPGPNLNRTREIETNSFAKESVDLLSVGIGVDTGQTSPICLLFAKHLRLLPRHIVSNPSPEQIIIESKHFPLCGLNYRRTDTYITWLRYVGLLLY